jgi:uncharacterized protein (TIGR00369 family)
MTPPEHLTSPQASTASLASVASLVVATAGSQTDQQRYDAFVQDFGIYIPFADFLGFEFVSSKDGHSVLAYQALDAHMNSFHVPHGGALMTLMDVSMANAARSVESGSRVVTIELKSSFFNPAKGLLKAYGSVLHRTKSMAFMETKIMDAQNVLCAHATGTFRYVKP